VKALLFVLAVLSACTKQNDAQTLEHEAVAVVKFYTPRLDALDKRVNDIFRRGTTIPANLPGIADVGKRLTEARDTIVQLRGIIGPGRDQKSPVEKQAEAAAKENRIADLEKLIHETETTLDHGITVINDDLDAVESWIAQYDRVAALPKTEAKSQTEAPTPQAPTPEAPKPEAPKPEQPAPPTH
jgi:hypothetical protein